MAMEISVSQARRLLLDGACLLHDPGRAPTAVNLVRKLGFLQLDSINTVERAHELILHTRLDKYRVGGVFKHLRSRELFEHWTHDASLLPVEHYPHWHRRFEEFKSRGWHLRRLGKDADATIAAVLGRIEKDGPLLSRDFEHARGPEKASNGGWWNWKPAKAALEYLWRTGQLSVADRINFQKLYDLPTRTYSEVITVPPVAEPAHLDWACRQALTRLGVATPKELAEFFGSISAKEAAGWVDRGLRSGELVAAEITLDDGGRTGVAFADVKKRLARLPDPPKGARLLAPFDPLIRDRARTLRLFGFHYRFEAFTQAAKRVHGYYVLPVLVGDRFIARLDTKFDRQRSTLMARVAAWESGVSSKPALRDNIAQSVDRLKSFLQADHVQLTTK